MCLHNDEVSVLETVTLFQIKKNKNRQTNKKKHTHSKKKKKHASKQTTTSLIFSATPYTKKKKEQQPITLSPITKTRKTLVDLIGLKISAGTMLGIASER